MCISGPSAPTPPARLPEAPRTPDPTTAAGVTGDNRRRAAASQSILTGPRGITDGAATEAKTLLGR